MKVHTSKLARQATFRQLQVFECIAKHNSFTRAAKELQLTQPTVSMQIKKLSEVLQIELFEQIGRKVYLTAAGQKLLVATRSILNSLEVIEEEVNHMKGLTGGSLHIVVISTAQYFIPRVIKKFSSLYPDITVVMMVGNKEKLLDRMQHNRDDFYILGHPPEGLKATSKRLVTNPLCFVAHADHPLAGKKQLSLDDLDNEVILMRESGSGIRSHIESVFTELGFAPQRQIVLGSNELLRLGLLDNLGIGVVSLPTLLKEYEQGKIVLLDVEHFPIQRDWYLAYPKGKVLSLAAKAFVEILEQESLQLDQHIEKIGV
ncbi:MAG: LysR substrate-binding domain-containing protein [bacterium]